MKARLGREKKEGRKTERNEGPIHKEKIFEA